MKLAIRISILLLLPWAVLGVLYALVASRPPAPDSEVLVRTSDRRVVWSGDSFGVQLHLNGQHLTPTPPRSEPYAVVTLIDRSASMGSGPDSRLEAAKQAVAHFSRIVATTAQPVGVVAFDSKAESIHEISPDGRSCAEDILKISAGGGTDLAAALEVGHQMLKEALESGNLLATRGLMVLLSDGSSASEPAQKKANRAKEENIRIITVGLGSAVDERQLLSIASHEADFRIAATASAVGVIFTNIASEIAPIAGRDGVLQEQFHHGAFTLDQPITGFKTEVDESGSRFGLDLPWVFGQKIELSYVLRAHQVGVYPLVLEPAKLTFTHLPKRAEPERLDPEGAPSTAPDPPVAEQEGMRPGYSSSLDPLVLVISPGLILVLYLPAIAFFVRRLLVPTPRQEAASESRPWQRPSPLPLKIQPPAPPKNRRPRACLFVGLGLDGGRALRQIADQLRRDRHLTEDAEEFVRFLHLDFRPEAPGAADERFAIHHARLPPSLAGEVEELRTTNRVSEHRAWLPSAEIRRATAAELDFSDGSRGRRWASRLALFKALRGREPAFQTTWDSAIEWLKRRTSARIVLVGDLGSGSGGLFTDLAHLLHAAVPSALRAKLPIVALGLGDVPAEDGRSGARKALNQGAFLAELDRLLVATGLPQPMVYHPAPAAGAEYLAGEMRGPIYFGFFLMTSPTDDPGQVDSRLLSQAAAIACLLTEQGLMARLQARLDGLRGLEEEYRSRHLEGVIHSLSLHVVRFPVAELVNRMSDCFILSILGDGGLVGAGLPMDDARFDLELAPAAVERAQEDWAELCRPPADHEGERSVSERIYRAFCEAAVGGEPAGLGTALLDAAGEGHRLPSVDALIETLRGFATERLGEFLNGGQELSEEEAARWRSGRIGLLYAVVGRLAEFADAALERNGVDTSASSQAMRALISELRDWHHEGRRQASRWLDALIDSGCGGDATGEPKATVDKGLCRLASDRSQRLGERLDREASRSWQILLRDEDGDPRWREDQLYEEYFREFLDRERGLLLRFEWQLESADGGSFPELRLQLLTDRSQRHAPDDEGVAALMRQLEAVAEHQSRQLKTKTIFDRLRLENGEFGLDALMRRVAGKARPERRRTVFAMVPDLAHQDVDRIVAKLGDVERVQHLDRHSMRLVTIDSVIPVRTLELRHQADPGTASIPYIFLAEQQSERLRRLIEDLLGEVPPSDFSPLTRLLVAGPMPRSDWAGLLAEGGLRPEDWKGRQTVVLRDEFGVEAAPEPQGRSQVWALLYLVYGLFGRQLARRILERWRQRSAVDRLDLLAAAARYWQTPDDSLEAPGRYRDVHEQVALILRLEETVERRRQKYAEPE